MTVNEKYNLWLTLDEDTKKELESVTDEKETEDRFYKDLSFGTGGLRGIMGPGTNRMNIYTVGAATQGLSNYLNINFKDRDEISVVVGHDCRNNSRLSDFQFVQLHNNSAFQNSSFSFAVI